MYLCILGETLHLAFAKITSFCPPHCHLKCCKSEVKAMPIIAEQRIWYYDKQKFSWTKFCNDHVIMKITKIFHYKNLEPHGIYKIRYLLLFIIISTLIYNNQMWPGLQKSTMWGQITLSYIFANIFRSEYTISFP